MPAGVLIPRLPTSTPIFAPSTPDFESLVAQDLGNLGTAADGFDALFSIPALALQPDLDSLIVLEDLLSAMDFADGALELTLLQPFASAVADFQAAGDVLMGNVDTAVGTSPSSGGGGGGSGGGTTACPMQYPGDGVSNISDWHDGKGPYNGHYFAAATDGSWWVDGAVYWQVNQPQPADWPQVHAALGPRWDSCFNVPGGVGIHPPAVE